MLLLISKMNACDVMGSRACGKKPEKEEQESDPVKYCVASRVYFECVHKKYRGCENNEKYEMAMESMMKGKNFCTKSFRKIVQQLKNRKILDDSSSMRSICYPLLIAEF